MNRVMSRFLRPLDPLICRFNPKPKSLDVMLVLAFTLYLQGFLRLEGCFFVSLSKFSLCHNRCIPCV